MTSVPRPQKPAGRIWTSEGLPWYPYPYIISTAKSKPQHGFSGTPAVLSLRKDFDLVSEAFGNMQDGGQEEGEGRRQQRPGNPPQDPGDAYAAFLAMRGFRTKPTIFPGRLLNEKTGARIVTK